MTSVKFILRLLLLITAFTAFTFGESGANSEDATTHAKIFQAKSLSEDSVWHLQKQFNTKNPSDDSVTYKVSDLVDTFFIEGEHPLSPNWLVKGIRILSGQPSLLGSWEYNDMVVPNYQDKSWRPISVQEDKEFLSQLAIPHYFNGVIDIERYCHEFCNTAMISQINESQSCQEVFQQYKSSIFIPISHYVRFNRRKQFWNYFEGLANTKLVFQPVYGSITTKEKLAEKHHGTNDDVFVTMSLSDIMILTADWTDCSGAQILSQPKRLDSCNVCGGDNSTCKTCDQGKVLYRGNCRKIEDFVHSDGTAESVDYPSQHPSAVSNEFHPPQKELHLESISLENTDESIKIPTKGENWRKCNVFWKDLTAQKSTRVKHNGFKITKMNMENIEILGPDVVYADEELLFPVRANVDEISNAKSTFKWKYQWQINGTLRKGIDWNQQETKLIIAKNALKPLSVYKIWAFMQIETEPGIVYTANKIVKVRSRGVKAVLNVHHVLSANSKEVLVLDAVSSMDFDTPNGENVLKFIWKCISVEINDICTCNVGNSSLGTIGSYDYPTSPKKKILEIDKQCFTQGEYIWTLTVLSLYSSSTVSETVQIKHDSALSSSENSTGESLRTSCSTCKDQVPGNDIQSQSNETNDNEKSAIRITRSTASSNESVDEHNNTPENLAYFVAEAIKSSDEKLRKTLKDAKTLVSEMCETILDSNDTMENVGNDTRIKVVYLRNSSTDFNPLLEMEGVDNSSRIVIDFQYFLRKYFSECGTGTNKTCQEICFSAVHFLQVLYKPNKNDLEHSMWEPMVYIVNPNSTTLLMDQTFESVGRVGPILFEFTINDIPSDQTAECRVWNTRKKEWNDVCHSAIVQKHNDRVIQCFCQNLGYLKILKTQLPKKENVSMEYKEVQFSIINPDYNLTMGNMKAIFEISLAKQLVKALNIMEAQIEELDATSGGLIVKVRLGNKVPVFDTSRKNRHRPRPPTLDDIVDSLDVKITNGSLLLMDLENRPLNISQSSVTARLEEMNIVLGIIIGSILIIGIVTFSVSSFRKYRQEKLDSVRPIKQSPIAEGGYDLDKFDSPYSGNHVSIEEFRGDTNYDGIGSIDSDDITIQRVTSLSEPRSNNPPRASAYINNTVLDMNSLHDETVHTVSVTNASGEHSISTFPNTIIS